MRFPTPEYDEWDELYGLVRDLFMAGAVTCFLYAFSRIATGTMLTGQVKALKAYGDAFAPEEREVLIHKIKKNAMHH